MLKVEGIQLEKGFINFGTKDEVLSSFSKIAKVDENKAYRLLKGLVDQQVLEPVNKGRYAKYRYQGDI